MTILFICSSLETGKDGVGDYTRKLACALIKQGNKAAVIALNDKFIKEGFIEECQADEGAEVQVIRFANSCLWQERITAANAYISRFNPDWISLQYVPYGYHKKGLPFQLPKQLKAITAGYRCHIMFHEMWIGISKLSPLKHKMYGLFQKRITVALIKALAPQKVSTTNRLYQLVLKEKSISAALLPLFSNIAFSTPDAVFIKVLQEENGIDFKDASHFTLGVFGTLYPYARLYSEIPAYIEKMGAGKKAVLIFLGRNSHPEELGKLKKALDNTVQIIELGGLEAEKVSTVFSVLTEAVLCTPVEHIGKSGVYAALNYHGVKVNVLSSQAIPKYENEINAYNRLLERKNPAAWGVDAIAVKFMHYLEINSDEVDDLQP